VRCGEWTETRIIGPIAEVLRPACGPLFEGRQRQEYLGDKCVPPLILALVVTLQSGQGSVVPNRNKEDKMGITLEKSRP
jgi:hypothetical protein